MSLCPRCGEPLDDFSPCACALGFVRDPVPHDKNANRFAGGMRRMVARKLAKQRAAIAAVVVRSKP